jgi:hypothetical protein
LLAEFDGDGEYRIVGNRGTVPYFVLAVWSAAQPPDRGARNWAPAGYAGLKEFDPSELHTTAMLQNDKMQFAENGDFEIILSQHEHPGNWIKLMPDTVGMLIRVVHYHRSQERSPTFKIRRIDNAKPRPIKPEEMSAGLAEAAQDLLGYTELVRSWWQDNLAKRPNRLQFSQKTYLSNGGVPDRHFAFGVWKKASTDALVLEFKPPQDSEYWIFQLCNMWQENLDNYPDGQGYVNRFMAKYEPDGRVRVVISEVDPGIGGNWIDPSGHVQGGMGLRVIKTHEPPQVTSWLLPIETLKRGGAKLLAPDKALKSGDVVP